MKLCIQSLLLLLLLLLANRVANAATTIEIANVTFGNANTLYQLGDPPIITNITVYAAGASETLTQVTFYVIDMNLGAAQRVPAVTCPNLPFDGTRVNCSTIIPILERDTTAGNIHVYLQVGSENPAPSTLGKVWSSMPQFTRTVLPRTNCT